MKSTSWNIAPTSLREYATARGWVQLNEALKDGLVVLNHEKYKPRQLVYPKSSSDPGYGESVSLAVHRLAEIEDKSVTVLLRDVQRIHEDTYRFRLYDDRTDDDSIPFGYALSAIKGSQMLLLSAATTVLWPRVYHPRLGMKEAQRVLDESRFNHTEPDSFILNVSCPINALDKGGDQNLFGGDLPMVRKTSLVLINGLQEIVTAIEEGSEAQLIERVQKEEKPIVSANLAGALEYFEYSDSKHALEVRVDWAASLPGPGSIATSVVRIQNDYFPRIRDVRVALKPKQGLVEEEYVGTVETLNGEMGTDGRRSGEVILRIQLRDSDELVRARVILDAEQYEQAIVAHRTESAYVTLRGKLKEGNQPRTMADVVQFSMLSNRPDTSLGHML